MEIEHVVIQAYPVMGSWKVSVAYRVREAAGGSETHGFSSWLHHALATDAEDLLERIAEEIWNLIPHMERARRDQAASPFPSGDSQPTSVSDESRR